MFEFELSSEGIKKRREVISEFVDHKIGSCIREAVHDVAISTFSKRLVLPENKKNSKLRRHVFKQVFQAIQRQTDHFKSDPETSEDEIQFHGVSSSDNLSSETPSVVTRTGILKPITEPKKSRKTKLSPRLNVKNHERAKSPRPVDDDNLKDKKKEALKNTNSKISFADSDVKTKSDTQITGDKISSVDDDVKNSDAESFGFDQFVIINTIELHHKLGFIISN